jgi:formylglycine-generating enzyme required for sulfatase activity
MKKWHKSALVVFGALVLSTALIQASDVLRGIEGGLSGMVIESESACGSGAVQMNLGSHSLCVDMFEASAGTLCPHTNPQNSIETQENANAAACKPISQKDVLPWRFVSYTQAQQFCARDGKRLPTNEEWYKSASGITTVDECTINAKNDAPALTGTPACVTPSGAYDMVGNVWEWIDGQVTDGVYENRTLPQSGYVALVDTNGVVVETKAEASAEFGDDYAQTDSKGLRGIIRGGFYKSGSDAGVFAQNLSVPLDFKAIGVGFRCIKDL